MMRHLSAALGSFMADSIPGSTELFGAVANGMLAGNPMWEQGEVTDLAEILHRQEVRAGKRRAFSGED